MITEQDYILRSSENIHMYMQVLIIISPLCRRHRRKVGADDTKPITLLRHLCFLICGHESISRLALAHTELSRHGI